MKTSTFLIAPLLISLSSASVIGRLENRNNNGAAEVQWPAPGEGPARQIAPIARRYTNRNRVRRQIPQLPKLPTGGVPGAQPQLPGQIPTVPDTGVSTSSVVAELPATTAPAIVIPSAAPVLPAPTAVVSEVVPSAAPGIPVTGVASGVVPSALPEVPATSAPAGVVPSAVVPSGAVPSEAAPSVAPTAGPVLPIVPVPVLPTNPGTPGAGTPGEPGAAPIVFPPGSGDLPGKAPTGPVDDPLKVEGDLPPGFSVIGNISGPSGVVEQPVQPSAAPTGAVSAQPGPISSGAAGLPLPTAPAEVPASSAPAGLPLPIASSAPAGLPLPSAPAEIPASSAPAGFPLPSASAPANAPVSSAPAALPLPSAPAQIVPVVPGAAIPSLGAVQPVVSSPAAQPSLPALPNGFSVISNDIPAAAAATAGVHDFDRQEGQNGPGNVVATPTGAGSSATPTDLPEGFKVISQGALRARVTANAAPMIKKRGVEPPTTTLIKRVRRSVPRSEDEELMYRYGGSK
ncbi:hypothetical protein TWF730_002004 [Orbilia blumenaviensis]|uniref:Uncharacterized protein n=1 Tax=Orbilia blumenaviensis TaxID=1796055 RepID=A0AAV9UDD4_9PEZI